MSLHKTSELGWAAAWIGVVTFVFLFFIPTVNRFLNP